MMVDRVTETIWKKYNTNGNDYLDYDELKKMIIDTHEKLRTDGVRGKGEAKVPSEDEMMAIFKEYDENNDGLVEKHEVEDGNFVELATRSSVASTN